MMSLISIALIAALDLPTGPAPEPVALPHFPDRYHAFVWRNWELVPPERMAEVVGASTEAILETGHSMGLGDPYPVSDSQWKRSYITIIRRNWHLLPYDQLLQLLDWDREHLAFTLREDDFLYVKLGNLKPDCKPIHYSPPDAGTRKWEQAIAMQVRAEFPEGLPGGREEAPFEFVSQLSAPPAPEELVQINGLELGKSCFHPRYCSSYFALYGDPLLDPEADPYPDGYLARLAASGVDGVWLQAVLYKMAPFPWEPSLSEGYEKRLESLKKLVERAKRHGIGVYLYLNEPRAMPLSFFEKHPGLKGVVEGDFAALCTSVPEVRQFLHDAVATICRAVPDLSGFFTISASENMTNCHSHYRGAECPLCSKRDPAEVIAELHQSLADGIQDGGCSAQLFAWDWGWQDAWVEKLAQGLPKGSSWMSVSEWSIPIQRGGVSSAIGEYSLSVIGPGPRATHNWSVARKNGLGTMAKVQIGVTWELGAVPYHPVLANVTEHIWNLTRAGVNGLMLGWTHGGYPSPNLEAAALVGSMTGAATSKEAVDQVLNRVAEQRYGKNLVPVVTQLWKQMSRYFQEFPFDGQVVYNAPLQVGPANLVWEKPTGFRATMVGIPYDDLSGWRGLFPEEVFIGQFRKIADGFDAAIKDAKASTAFIDLSAQERLRLRREIDVAEACMIYYRSVANQAQFICDRNTIEKAANLSEAAVPLQRMDEILRDEILLAKRLYVIQSRDSRIGFEATNHYFSVRMDLAEKILNCQDLLSRWLPEQKNRFKP